MRKLFFLFCFSPILLFGQINESDTLDLKASLSLTGFYQEGNVETFIFRGRSDFSVKFWEKWVYKNSSSYVYQEFGKVKADEDILSLNFLYFNPETRIYPLLLGFVSTNFRRQIDLRSLIGAGLSFQVREKEDINDWLKFSLTMEYEQTEFETSDFNQDKFDGESDINTVRGTIWVSGRHPLLKKRLIITHESYFQPSLSDDNNYRWQANVGLELPVWSFLNFKIDYLQTHESIVIQGQKQEDRFITFGFTLKNF